MKLPRFVESWVVKLALSRLGPALTKGVGALAAYVVAAIASKAPGLENHVNEWVVAGALYWLIDYGYTLLPASILKEYGTELQDAVNRIRKVYLKVDGYIGPKTVETVTLELQK